jgi:hypothetical protein
VLPFYNFFCRSSFDLPIILFCFTPGGSNEMRKKKTLHGDNLKKKNLGGNSKLAYFAGDKSLLTQIILICYCKFITGIVHANVINISKVLKSTLLLFFFRTGFQSTKGVRLIRLMRRGICPGQVLFPLEIESGIPRIQ